MAWKLDHLNIMSDWTVKVESLSNGDSVNNPHLTPRFKP